MYTNIDTIFVNSAFDNIFNKVFEAQPAITWPINLYTEGDNEVIEIAVVGKEKEDIKIQSKIGTDGIVHLTIDISDAKKDSEKSKPVKLTQKEIDKLTKQRQADEKKRVSKLARLYNEMKPADAAKILETMDNDIVIAIFQRMDESQVSQILTEFDPDRAATISKIMYVGAPKRVQQVTNENGAVQQQQLQ